MNVYEYFHQIRKLDFKVKNAQAELERLQVLSESVNAVDYSVDRVQNEKANKEPAFVYVLDQIDSMSHRLAELIAQYNDLRDLIFTQIESLDSVQARILYLRYFEFMSLERVSCEMNYSYYGTRSIYRAAIRKFKALYGEEF